MEGSIGNEETYAASAAATFKSGPLAAGLQAEWFSTGGYPVLAAGQRGPVDTRANVESRLIDLQAEWQIDRETSVRVRGRGFEEERENGTQLTQNESRGDDLSVVLTRRFSAQEAELQLSGYGQRRRFRATFSSVNLARDLETPALDQFHVPAEAMGGSAVWSMALGEHRFLLGADGRGVEGETNEHFLWNGTAFRRLREAGGTQTFAGLFAEDTWALSSRATIVGGVRLDHWSLTDGFRKETERATGAVLTDSRFADRNGNEINGRLGARLQTTETLALRGAFYSGFRVPTLNELYRPFRVGNDITEANAALRPEHLLGGEVALEWQVTPTFRLSGTGFLNRLEDAVGNITIGVGPGTFNPGGFVPAGGVLRQRRNIELVTAPGFEGTAEWQVHPSLRLRAGYLFTRPTIEQADDAALIGNLLAQTPEHVLTGGVEWSPLPKWFLNAQMRYSDRQFEDDQNSRTLAPFTTVDAAVRYEVSAQVSAALRVENLFDQEIETGKSATGLTSIGAPRLVSLQVRWQL